MEDLNKKQTPKITFNNIWYIFFVFGIFIGAFIVGWTISGFILYGKNDEIEYFAHIGDFLSGVLGAIIASINVILLFKTLTSQIETAKSQQDFNYHNTDIYINQQFSSVFTSLIKLYHSTLDGFKINHYIGKAALKQIVDNIRQSDIDSRESFNKFYTENREIAAAYFRLIYRIYKYIDESELDEKKKFEYAHIMRSQFSEDELVLLKYNALTINGLKMQDYISTYNLLEHLPLSKLHEFVIWYSPFYDDKVFVSNLDSVLLNIKYSVISMLSDINYISNRNYGFQKIYIKGNVYRNEIYITYDLSQDNVLGELYFKYNDIKKYRRFLISVMREFFLKSSFAKFAKNIQQYLIYDINVPVENLNQRKVKIKIKNKSRLPIVIVQEQYNNLMKNMESYLSQNHNKIFSIVKFLDYIISRK